MTKSNTNIDNLLLEKTNISSIITAATKSTPPPKNVCVNFVMPSSDLQVYVDMYYLEMAISNILRNAYDAIAESKQNGKVSIKLFSEFDSVVIAISDTGPGVNKKTKSIDKEALNYALFEILAEYKRKGIPKKDLIKGMIVFGIAFLIKELPARKKRACKDGLKCIESAGKIGLVQSGGTPEFPIFSKR